jgi:hypothetical protein
LKIGSPQRRKDAEEMQKIPVKLGASLPLWFIIYKPIFASNTGGEESLRKC